MSKITVYTKPVCVQCNQTKKTLDKMGLTYDTIDVTEDETAYEYVVKLGYRAAPVVVVSDSSGNLLKHWSGFNPEKINALKKEGK